MKSVAIIGAGPSGLVTAKKFLLMYPGAFKVTLFDKQNRVGGLWAVDAMDSDKPMNPLMPTNLSKYSVSFSDLSWESVKISTGDPNSSKSSSYIPDFPKAWMVGQYLDQYRQRYISEDHLRLNCSVTKVSRVNSTGSEKGPSWKVEWEEKSSAEAVSGSALREEIFDYVVITSGFLHEPISSQIRPEISDDQEHGARIIHSSKYRHLADLVPHNWNGAGDILVYGGSMSGVEVAASIAYQISNKKYSPTEASFGNPKVYHVTSRPFYVFTPMAPTDISRKSPSFLPLDLVFFDISHRPLETVVASCGRMAPAKSQMMHGLFRSQVGGDQGDVDTSALCASSTDEAPYISNATGCSYIEFVRSGNIIPVPGRVDKLELSATRLNDVGTLETQIVNGQKSTDIRQIVGAVEATGYKPNLRFLSDDLQELLGYDQNHHRIPILLTNAQTSSNRIPNLAFVGMHEGSYWGSEECQARIVVEAWAHELDVAVDNKINENEETLQDLRKGMAEKSKDVPQLWYGDYVGHMEQCALHGYAERQDQSWKGRTGPAIPARYLDRSDDAREANLTVEKLQQISEKASTNGLFVARAAFIGLQGCWHIYREIKSSMKSSPSGTLIGTAEFHPRQETGAEYDAEYLYIEQGDFKTDQGFEMKASRRYAYRYRQDTDQLSTWFVKLDGKTVDYLFLDLSVKRLSEDDYWIATGHHPCSPDVYDAKYTFQFRGMALGKFVVEYKVIGPQKDYTSTTTFTRP